ncbi:MAG: anti-sigma factor [Pseudomonadales bacterium]
MHDFDLTDAEQRNQAAAEYVLGSLDPDEKARFEALLSVSHDLQREVEQWREHLDVLNTSLPAVKPPSAVWKKIKQRTAPAGAGFVWSWQSLAGFSLALMLSVGLFLQWPQHQIDDETAWVPLIFNEENQPGWIMNASMDTNQLVVESKRPVVMPSNSVYEIWLMEDGHEPMSLGFLPASGKRTIEINEDLAERILNCEVVVTMEGPEGAPDGYNMGPVSGKGNWNKVSF